ncbi:MAG: hypothetical protein ACE5E6_06680 [Phycisphaerae bacterium]
MNRQRMANMHGDGPTKLARPPRNGRLAALRPGTGVRGGRRGGRWVWVPAWAVGLALAAGPPAYGQTIINGRSALVNVSGGAVRARAPGNMVAAGIGRLQSARDSARSITITEPAPTALSPRNQFYVSALETIFEQLNLAIVALHNAFLLRAGEPPVIPTGITFPALPDGTGGGTGGPTGGAGGGAQPGTGTLPGPDTVPGAGTQPGGGALPGGGAPPGGTSPGTDTQPGGAGGAAPGGGLGPGDFGLGGPTGQTPSTQ